MNLAEQLRQAPTILDVRSPAEFEQGHVPGAQSLPLFSNEERHEVGLCYKQKGKDAAVRLGLGFVAPKMLGFIDQAELLCPERSLVLYCWRGGMRSGSMGWLLKTAGFNVEIIPGGYKTWRKTIHAAFEAPISLINLCGLTGSGKTALLKVLQAHGEQMIDLEGLANHRGSAFGQMGAQPSTEHFENLLGHALLQLDTNQPIWVEDESRSIGKVHVPLPLYHQMSTAPMVFVDKPFDQRADALCRLYGKASSADLISAFERITRRLGGQHVKAAVKYLDEGNLKAACEIALRYYDKSYSHSLRIRETQPIFSLDVSDLNEHDTAEALKQWKTQNLPSLVTAQAVDAK